MEAIVLSAAAGLCLGNHSLKLIALAVSDCKSVHDSIRIRDAHLHVVTGEVHGIKLGGCAVGIFAARHSVHLMGTGVRADDGIAIRYIGCDPLSARVLLV